MNQMYTLLIVVHIFAAIVGVGPSFVMNRILKSAKNRNELIFAHQMVKNMNKIANIGFVALLPTGWLMGWIHPSLFRMMWYDASLALFAVSGLYLHLVIERKMKPMLEMIKSCDGEAIPQSYKMLSGKLVPYDLFGKLILVVIIILMVLKP